MKTSNHPLLRCTVRVVGSLVALSGALIVSASVASAAIITVTTNIDEFDTTPNATCSLREAIQSANLNSNFGGCVGSGPYGSDTIVFSPTINLVILTNTTTLSDNDDNSSLDLDISDNLPLNALIIDGGPGVTIQAGFSDRIFDILPSPSPGPVILRNLTIQGGSNPSTETGGTSCFLGGGGVRNRSGGALTLENVTIRNNTMQRNGGGVCHEGAGALVVLSSTIENNIVSTPSFNGGGIFYYAIGSLTVQNSRVVSNTAQSNGGGIWCQASSLTVQNSTVLSNTAQGDGGGIWCQASSLTVQNSTVLSNTAQDNGGGIYDSSSAAMTILNSNVLSNVARTRTGGGVWTSGGTSLKQILTSTVAYNRAGLRGGGIYNNSSNGLQIFNSTVLSNTTDNGNGGGIWSDRLLQIDNSRVLSNTANNGNGGGIYHTALTVSLLLLNNSRVAHNLAVTSSDVVAGGGIWNGNNGIATLNNTTVEHNRAQSPNEAFGGGIQNFNGRLSLLNNSQVRHNLAYGNNNAGGGGVSNEGTNAVFVLIASSVSTNTSQSDELGYSSGGGIYSVGGGTASLLNGEVRNNRAVGGQNAQGGGVASSGILTVTSSLVISNAITAITASLGGGIWTGGSSPVLITNTRIHTNAVAVMSGNANGGGWYNTVDAARLVNSDVRLNRAQGDGGGVYNSGDDVQINNSAISQNRAGFGGIGDGGGVYNSGATTIIETSQVLTNIATDDGGGVYNALGASISILTGTLQANQATRGGGAYNNGEMNILTSTVQGNTAVNGGGVHNNASGDLFIRNSTLRSNSANAAGGGLYNAASAGVIYSTLMNNTATAGGGAQIAAGGVLTSENSTFSGNGPSNGGGLNVVGVTSRAFLTHTTVASNTGVGGVRVAAGGTGVVFATLLAYNADNNCVGSIVDDGYSMSSDNSCSFSFNNVNPFLKPLALNGGQTLNHALSPGSPALDRVPTASCGVNTDQRFLLRPQGGSCDIGAFELEEADLQVSKSASPSPAFAGQIVTYTVVVTNGSSFGAAENIVLTDTLLGGATFGGVVITGGFTLQSSTSTAVTFTLPSLGAGMTTTLVFTATVPVSALITNTVGITSGYPDPNVGNNIFTVATPVFPVANLLVTKAQDFVPFAPGVVLPGSTVTYTIVVTNNGPSPVSAVTLTDTLASGVGFVDASGSGWSCNFSAPTVTCDYSGSPLAVGTSASVTITVTAPITSNTVFTNSAVAVATGTFPGTPFSSNVVTLTTAPQANLQLTKTATPSSVFAGQLVTYTVVVTNLGPDPATNVVITDVFQGGATFGSVVAVVNAAYQSNTSTAVTFTVGTLPVSGTAAAVYTVIAPPSGVITNTATVGSNTIIDPSLIDNAASTTTPVTPVANLSISKVQSFVTGITGTISPTAQITYTILVTNNGPSIATDVIVTDNLPTGLTSISATGSGWLCNVSGLTVTCTRPTLDVGSAPAIQIVATVPATPGLVLTNTATVNSATHPNTPVNSNSVSVKVQFRFFMPIARRLS